MDLSPARPHRYALDPPNSRSQRMPKAITCKQEYLLSVAVIVTRNMKSYCMFMLFLVQRVIGL